MIGIYVWKLNDIPKYVGQSMSLETRMLNRHRDSTVLNNAIKKYGYDSFEKEIICLCDLSELCSLEIFYIKEFHTHVSEEGYNVTWGGDIPPMTGLKHSDETRRKISVAVSGENNPNFGMPRSPETREKIGFANRGENCLPETREKLRIANGGENSPMFGKHLSEITKQKLRDNHGDTTGEKNGNFGKKNKNASSVYYGVSKVKRKIYIYWEVAIRIDGKKYYIGNYKEEFEAALAYNDYVIANGLSNSLNIIQI